MRDSRWVATGIACLLLAGACSAANPTERFGPAATTEPDDPTKALAGRAVEALGVGGMDAVMRIGADGFQLPDNERLYDLHGDRVLSVRSGTDGGRARLIVRDLAGHQLREIDAGMQVPQTGIVRADDVYFGGIDFAAVGDPFDAWDRGAWVAHGDAPPVSIVAATQGVAIYHTFELSPDGRTLGISRCGEGACATILIRQDAPRVEIPKAGLVALTSEVALLIGEFSEVTAYAVADGAELWRADTEGISWTRSFPKRTRDRRPSESSTSPRAGCSISN